jgi:imidazole glycerol-phosphate synthase subunit HisH
MIGVIDYGMGNILSVQNALLYLGANARICELPDELRGADRLVLPGVGSFADGMRLLRERGLVDELTRLVVDKHVPILGICLGMQLMATRSFEGGENNGLGWIDADVVRLDIPEVFRVPHVGWDDITFLDGSMLFEGIPASSDVYFDHSFHMHCRDKANVLACCDFGGRFTAAVQKDTIIGTQFHPEKSQDYGLRILDNFVRWTPC